MNALHDAELDLLHIDRVERRVALGFRAVDGSRIEYHFEGVRTLRLSGVLLQNVVLRILETPDQKPVEGEIRRIVTWMFSGEDNRLMIDYKVVEQNVAEVLAGEIRLFHVDPSWGAEVGVLCKSFSISDWSRDVSSMGQHRPAT